MAGNLIELDLIMPRRVGQTLAELKFALSLHACAKCGTFVRRPFDITYIGSPSPDAAQQSHFAVECTCPQCGEYRQLKAWMVNEPRVEVPRLHLVNSGHSQLIEPAQLMIELDRLNREISDAPSTLHWAACKATFAQLRRAQTCANELCKFIQPGNTALVAAEYTDAGRAHRAAHHDRYRARAVLAEQQRLTALAALYEAEIPRMHAAEREELGPPKTPVGEFTRETIEAHGVWLANQRSGAGQLHLEHQRLGDINRHGLKLPWTKMVGVELLKTRFSYSNFDEADWTQVVCKQVTLQSTSLNRSTLRACEFRDSLLNLIDLEAAQITDGVFDNCQLFRSDWKQAVVVNTAFRHCSMHSSQLEGARFVGCSFSGSFFGVEPSMEHLATSNGARFEDCDFSRTGWKGRDLSGATFVRCKFAGSGGSPRAHANLVLQDCDMNVDEFLAMLAAREENQRTTAPAQS